MQAINLESKFALFSNHWSPRILAQVNDFYVKAAKVQGEFVWHAHPDTDELFMPVKGSVTIQFRDREVALNPGDILVVPKGVEHRPVADEECELMVFVRAGTVNTGTAGGELTVTSEPWI